MNRKRFAGTATFYCQIIVIIAAFFPGLTVGQDLHYSQFYELPASYSPAATGMNRGDIRAMVLYRNQWQSVPVRYRSFYGSVEWKARPVRNNLLTAGFQMARDKAGDAGLSWFQAGVSAAAAHRFGERQIVSAGFSVYLVERRFDVDGLKFKNQWGGTVFDPDLPSGEPFSDRSGLSASLSAGLFWSYGNSDSGSRFEAGAGISHLNKPVVSLGDFDEKLPVRISFFGSGKMPLVSRADVVFFSLYDQMSKARAIVGGAGIRLALTRGMANETNIQFAVAHRIGDAVIPSFRLERNNWTFGISYDWNVSAFQQASNGKGGMEIAVIWQKIPVKELINVNSCPWF